MDRRAQKALRDLERNVTRPSTIARPGDLVIIHFRSTVSDTEYKSVIEAVNNLAAENPEVKFVALDDSFRVAVVANGAGL